MTPDELERERAALLAILDTDKPMTAEVRQRIAAVAAADAERAMAADDFDGRLGRALGEQYAALFAESGIDDAVPGSMTLNEDRVYVRSQSRGRIEIGRLDYRPLLAVAAEVAEALEAKRQRPLAAKAAKKRGRQAEARALSAAGRSVPYIARALKVHPRTVQRYLAGRQTATDRETPG